jgi:aconitate hydratase
MKNTDYSKSLPVDGKTFTFYDFNQFAADTGASVERLPFSIKILVENLLRKLDGRIVTEDDLANIVRWQKSYEAPVEIPYHPARVLMQDFTGVPAVVDLAAMRDAVKSWARIRHWSTPWSPRNWSSTTPSRWTISAPTIPWKKTWL